MKAGGESEGLIRRGGERDESEDKGKGVISVGTVEDWNSGWFSADCCVPLDSGMSPRFSFLRLAGLETDHAVAVDEVVQGRVVDRAR